ncbi:MAG: metallophosphoesterase [Negativicutes bacterium]|jgi:hypothetical protein
MKIGIISDTHGNKKAIDKVLKTEPNVEMWLHAGDYTRDGEYLIKKSPVPVKMVAGNNDVYFGNEYPEELLFDVAGLTIWMTHGHRQRVKWDLKTIAAEGKSLGADIVIFGHTHEATVEYLDSVILINPGAAMPWNDSGYAILDIDEQGKISAELKMII